MKHIYLNLKRFDVPAELGGVNRQAPIQEYGHFVVSSTQEGLKKYDPAKVEFIQFLPEAHILNAVSARTSGSPLLLGSQGVYRENVAPGGNFGAFTTNRPAAAVKALGCEAVLIGHCEERNDKKGILAQAGVKDAYAINCLLNQEIRCAVVAGLKAVYCIGETAEEQPQWEQVLGAQLKEGLDGIEAAKEHVVIAYEPVWSIGPGKVPADQNYITKIARFVKEKTDGMDVVYGGGLKADNAGMLASIAEIDGGLIALTRFQGEIGFYPEEYLEIIRLYLGSGFEKA